MIVGRIEKLGIQWGIDTEERMERAAEHGASIVDIENDREKVLFDGSAWLAEKPVFAPDEDTVYLVKKEYVDERMKLLLKLIEESFAPALALIPAKYRSGIEDTFGKLKGLIDDGEDER